MTDFPTPHQIDNAIRDARRLQAIHLRDMWRKAFAMRRAPAWRRNARA